MAKTGMMIEHEQDMAEPLSREEIIFDGVLAAVVVGIVIIVLVIA